MHLALFLITFYFESVIYSSFSNLLSLVLKSQIFKLSFFFLMCKTKAMWLPLSITLATLHKFYITFHYHSVKNMFLLPLWCILFISGVLRSIFCLIYQHKAIFLLIVLFLISSLIALLSDNLCMISIP